MIHLKFFGRFQCRLATDVDPTDEPRGVSGYMKAVAGEPDLDRIIRISGPVVNRSHCPPVGVSVIDVFDSKGPLPGHPIAGATLDLLDEPRFEGRNWIIASDGYEPITPFHLRISKGSFELSRGLTPELPPFPSTAASGIQFAGRLVSELTGIWDYAAVWRDRAAKIESDLKVVTDEIESAALRSRLAMLAQPALLRFNPAIMMYGFALDTEPVINDPDNLLAEAKPDASQPWPVEFFMGGWDPDALGGVMHGYISIPLIGTDELIVSAPADKSTVRL